MRGGVGGVCGGGGGVVGGLGGGGGVGGGGWWWGFKDINAFLSSNYASRTPRD